MISSEEFRELGKWDSIEITLTDGKMYYIWQPRLSARKLVHSSERGLEMITQDEPQLYFASAREISGDGKRSQTDIFYPKWIDRDIIADIKYNRTKEDVDGENARLQFIVGAIFAIGILYYFFT